MKKFLTKSLFLLFLLLISRTAYSQAVCPSEVLKVNRVNGKIEFKNSSEPIQNVKLDLRKADSDKSIILETITTDENGLFEFKSVKKGKYILIVNYELSGPSLAEYRTVLKVKETNSKKDKPSILIRFHIDCFETEISTIK